MPTGTSANPLQPMAYTVSGPPTSLQQAYAQLPAGDAKAAAPRKFKEEPAFDRAEVHVATPQPAVPSITPELNVTKRDTRQEWGPVPTVKHEWPGAEVAEAREVKNEWPGAPKHEWSGADLAEALGAREVKFEHEYKCDHEDVQPDFGEHDSKFLDAAIEGIDSNLIIEEDHPGTGGAENNGALNGVNGGDHQKSDSNEHQFGADAENGPTMELDPNPPSMTHKISPELLSDTVCKGKITPEITGMIKVFNPDNGWGFIVGSPETNDTDVFLHRNQFETFKPSVHLSEHDPPDKKMKIRFALDWTDSAKPKAVHVRILEAAKGSYMNPYANDEPFNPSKPKSRICHSCFSTMAWIHTKCSVCGALAGKSAKSSGKGKEKNGPYRGGFYVSGGKGGYREKGGFEGKSGGFEGKSKDGYSYRSGPEKGGKGGFEHGGKRPAPY